MPEAKEGSLPSHDNRLFIELAGYRFWLEVDSEEGYERLEKMWQRYRIPGGEDVVSGVTVCLTHDKLPVIQVASKGRALDIAGFVCGPDGKRFQRVSHPSRVLFADSTRGEEPVLELREGQAVVLREAEWLYFSFLLLLWLMLHEHPVLALHGAVSAVAGHSLVLVGPSGAGKSTLSLALAQQGATYYGDELAFFTPNDHHLYVWQRDLYLRPGGVEALGSSPDTFTWSEAKPNDPKTVMKLPEPATPCPHDRVHILFLDGFAEEAALRPMEGGEAVRRLLQGVTYGDPSVTARLMAVSSLVNHYPCWRLTVGNPQDTAALLMAHAWSQS